MGCTACGPVSATGSAATVCEIEVECYGTPFVPARSPSSGSLRSCSRGLDSRRRGLLRPGPAAGVCTALARSRRASLRPADELADKHRPVVYLKEQSSYCDKHGEAYYPVSVETVLGKSTTTLFDDETTVKTAPTAADLYEKGRSFYLDLPGDPHRPECVYERGLQGGRRRRRIPSCMRISRRRRDTTSWCCSTGCTSTSTTGTTTTRATGSSSSLSLMPRRLKRRWTPRPRASSIRSMAAARRQTGTAARSRRKASGLSSTSRRGRMPSSSGPRSFSGRESMGRDSAAMTRRALRTGRIRRRG